MLSKISCDLFRQRDIDFHVGLNVVLGDDQARNSIGKSLLLLIVDFAMGGNSLLEDKAGAIKTLGHHEYRFEFIFHGERHHYVRPTENAEIVRVCDPSYECISVLSLDQYREELKSLYRLEAIELSFRAFVSPFSRIWTKGALDPDHPLSTVPKESATSAIDRLVAAFERSHEVSEESRALSSLKKKKKLITSSMRAGIIPKINKKKYKSNLAIIQENTQEISKAARHLGDALGVYHALFDADIREEKAKKEILEAESTRTLEVIERLKRDIIGVTHNLSSNIALLAEFFPSVDTDRLQKIEEFHKGLSKLVAKELQSEIAVHREQLEKTKKKIVSVEESIRAKLDLKGTPGDIFEKAFELKKIADQAEEENRLFELRSSIDDEIKLAAEQLESLVSAIHRSIEDQINGTLRCFTRLVYGATRSPSQIWLASGSSFEFSSPADSGTGKSYAGLIGLDLAMLQHTKLPFFIHDSPIYKNVEVRATRRIIRLLAGVRAKQVFLAIDEGAKFGEVTRERLLRHRVLQLDDNKLLYNKDWRDRA